MKKIFDWIKVNILGIEKPRRKKKHSKKKKLTARSKPKSMPKLKVKKASAAKVKPAPKAKPVKSAKPVKPAKKVPAPKAKLAPKPKFVEKKVGVITHFFPNVSAAIVKMTGAVEIGDDIHFKGPTTDFNIKIKSMQMNRAPIIVAVKGQEIGIQVPDKVRDGDLVYKVLPK